MVDFCNSIILISLLFFIISALKDTSLADFLVSVSSFWDWFIQPFVYLFIWYLLTQIDLEFHPCGGLPCPDFVVFSMYPKYSLFWAHFFLFNFLVWNSYNMLIVKFWKLQLYFPSGKRLFPSHSSEQGQASVLLPELSIQQPRTQPQPSPPPSNPRTTWHSLCRLWCHPGLLQVCVKLLSK